MKEGITNIQPQDQKSILIDLKHLCKHNRYRNNSPNYRNTLQLLRTNIKYILISNIRC